MEHRTLEQADIRFLGRMLPQLDEKTRRIFLGAFAERLGYGGASAISEATGVSRLTIAKGIKEVQILPCDPRAKAISGTKGVRSPGGGRKRIEDKFPDIRDALLSLFEGYKEGKPENPLCWTTKSLRRLASELKAKGYPVNFSSVGMLLIAMGFSLQQKGKHAEDDGSVPDTKSQFHFINSQAREFLSNHLPVISIDAKKKETKSNRRNEAEAERSVTKLHEDAGYNFDDSTRLVGISDTTDMAVFAVNSIRSWWEMVGKERYPEANKLLITAKGESKEVGFQLWNKCLAEFAEETGIEAHVCHLPQGTFRWHEIENTFFACVNKDWGGQPSVDLEVKINLIAPTTTDKD